ncbi:peptidoglycan DD-metalloendopeptidase family protein [Chungangia koreensis]|uniref:Peptidoglycan DD-metalloendopeptidase family protein n=1 Tax=Chungangia koreensis TaxID=752657 RepID=A0ABV8X9M3_9LACT
MNLKEKIGTLSGIQSKTPIHHSNMMKKAAVTGLLLSSLTFNIGFAKETNSNGLQKVFHIYNNGVYIGTVANSESVNELINDKIEKADSKYDELALSVGSGLSLVPEQVFQSETNDSATLKKLEDVLTVQAKAFALNVNGEAAVYVEDMAAFDEVLRQLKLRYVSEEELNEYEARKNSVDSLPPLAEGETRIVGIDLIENVTGITKEIAPENVLSVEEAVQYLVKGTLTEQKYVVQSGDVLSKIAAAHDLSTSELLNLNTDVTEETLLQPGMELNVTLLKPLVQVSVLKEQRETLAVKHGNIVEENDSMYKGDTKVKQEGKDGKKEVTYLLRESNGVQAGKSVQDEKIIVEPVEQIIVKGTKVVPSRGSGSFVWPAEGGYISSKMGYRWGSYHRGIDIARPSGYSIKSADNGVVTFSGRDGTYGNKVVINHNNGLETTYAHLSSIDVSVGETVPQGTKIGKMGSTGRSTGIHLHFEVRKNGNLVNPLDYLR